MKPATNPNVSHSTSISGLILLASYFIASSFDRISPLCLHKVNDPKVPLHHEQFTKSSVMFVPSFAIRLPRLATFHTVDGVLIDHSLFSVVTVWEGMEKEVRDPCYIKVSSGRQHISHTYSQHQEEQYLQYH